MKAVWLNAEPYWRQWEADFKLDKCVYLNVRCWQRQGAKLQGQCTDSRNYHSDYRLDKISMVNESELAINLVKAKRRKVVISLAKIGTAACRCYSNLSIYPTIVQPGESKYLKGLLKVNHTEHGKPDKPHRNTSGIPTVRKGDGLAGRGTKRKRMPICNGLDRGYYIYSRGYPTRKSADFEGGRD